MASLGHVAVGMAAAKLYRRGQPARFSELSSMVVWSGVSLLPDADVIGFSFGIRYADVWGHRGATHSLAFAALIGLLACALAGLLRLPAARTAVFAGCVVASHGLLDTLTDGGLGCALLWPLSEARYFAPWQPIAVAPIGRAFLSPVGMRVAGSELLQFAPLIAFSIWPARRPRG